MKKMQSLILLLLCLLMGYSASLHAEDVDIYVDSAGVTDTPNVLIVLDNSANFESNSGLNCTYVDGTSPSLGTSAGGVEQCAIYNVVSGLAPGSVNLGLMVYNDNDMRDVNGANCGGGEGGCLVWPIAEMTAANKAAFMAWVKTWRTSSSGSGHQIKSSRKLIGATMQESWAYFAGRTGLSGRDYSTVAPGGGCQKNFVIYIGNAWGSSSTPGDGGNSSPATALSNAPGVTTAQTTNITIPTRAYGSSTLSCGTYTMGNHTEGSGLYADEWARYMYQTDLYGSITGSQGITTYTVGLLGAQCKPDYPALLSSMAKYGGGKYFATSSSQEITDALYAILNEVQAVNSVFSSASLPVSVNADGTYLNQIFLGMFRPDASGNPRWLGNLKQYQLVKNDSGKYVLGDKNGDEAISSEGSGFITPTAVSFWSSKDTTTLPDSVGGFWVNEPKGEPANGYDSPDGEVVEKGGVAQQLRKENLTANFTAAEYGTTNPRRLYTYCPSGSGCQQALTNTANAFSTTNLAIPASAFGSSSSLRVTSIVRNGTTATVTTADTHNFNGQSVTISGADQNEYNVTQTVTGSGNTFTITGLTDYPTSPSQGTYTVAKVNAASQVSVSSMTYDSVTSTVTVITPAHSFTNGSTVVIGGALPGDYNGSFVVTVAERTGCPAATCFTYTLSQNPPATATNAYNVVVSPPSSSINVSTVTKSGGNIYVTTTAEHGFHEGQSIYISGNAAEPSYFNTTWTVGTVTGTKVFILAGASGNHTCSTSCGSVSPSTTQSAIATLTRSGATARATGLTSNLFGRNVNDTKTVNISLRTDNGGANESAYAVSNATITCQTTGCTEFTYTVSLSPPNGAASGTITASPPSATSAPVAAGSITRTGTSLSTVRIQNVTANVFSTGDRVTLAPTGTSYATSESAYYARTWTVTCLNAECTTLTFDEAVTRSPATPATGSNIKAYSGSTPPDKSTLIRWMRGQDNHADDELGPGTLANGTVTGITVRPSVHGDVLHSRPVVLNYGGSTGLVAYYGSNDGVYRAVNANKTAAIGSVPAGGELWGVILPEHYAYVNRLRLNTPELKFPTTVLPGAQPKDYFIDGPTGVYQRLDSNNAISQAFIYMTMRRGGKFLYGVDVSAPTNPLVKWRVTAGDVGFEELGQTWSRPRMTQLGTSTTPVMVFGAGYDPAQDDDPPVAADTMGRGIYVINAITGALVWSANNSCTTSATCRNVPGMDFAIPSDIAFVDRDGNGKTDTLYFGDLGGNMWRASVGNASSSQWTVTKIANLGCTEGASTCENRRKVFFPPAVLSVGQAGAAGSYDLVSFVSGDREHPLRTSVNAHNTEDMFFMVIDRSTDASITTTVSPITENQLTSATLTNDVNSVSTNYTYSGTAKGFKINFPGTGEKGVNAPNAVNGLIFFSTNRPLDPDPHSCSAKLGEARAYAVNPFTGASASSVLAGGGLPPSSVSGVVNVSETDDQGNTTESQEKFCIGCAMNCTGNDCSPLQNSPPEVTINKKLHRTYWYKK